MTPFELFEFLVLEGAQAGRSAGRPSSTSRPAIAPPSPGSNAAAVAAFDDADIARCLADPGIVRNRAKVNATVGNARAWLELDDPVEFLWGFVDGETDAQLVDEPG